MTAARQQRKRYRPVFAVFVALLCGLAGLPAALRAATTERIVADWRTGLAIGGYDPVAFYTDGEAVMGTADLELRYGGAIWRFANSGNRAAFEARPDVYMPKFGGYDPVGVARGVAVAGNPGNWAIVGEELFLFRDRDRLDRFVADPERFIGTADRKWPEVLQTLSP